MSADNGIYILPTPVSRRNPEVEYRVAECQAIENIDYYKEDDKRSKAYLVVLFGNSPVFTQESEAILAAHKLEKEISESEFPVLEYGVSVLHKRHLPFPKKMSKKMANKILDTDI